MPRARVDEFGEPGTYPLELRNTVIDGLEPGGRAFADALDPHVAVGRERQQLANLFQREAEVLRPADEPQARDGALVVLAVTGRPAAGLGNSPSRS